VGRNDVRGTAVTSYRLDLENTHRTIKLPIKLSRNATIIVKVCEADLSYLL
jgi:hypothetical protein